MNQTTIFTAKTRLFKQSAVIIAIVIGSTYSCFSKDTLPSTIYVGINQKAHGITLSATETLHVVDMKTGKEEKLPGKKNYMVFKNQTGLTIGNIHFGKKVKINPLHKGLLKIDGKRYRGKIMLIRNPDGTILVINQVFVEDYIRGILAREISPTWPEDALKTQAVISRTYALKNMHRHEQKGFNLCAEVHCQVYGGVESEAASIDKAVKQTRGMVVTYKKRLAQTVFFSTCGGYTERVDHVWKWNSVPGYLKGTKCSYCTQSTRYTWKEFASHKHLLAKLKSFGITEPIKSMRVSSRFRSGRAKYIMVKHGGKRKKINGNKFRMAIGPNVVRSTNIKSIKRSKKGFTFSGKGFGHGVGLCQWGAKGMAKKKYNYKQILKFYYPGTKLIKKY